MQVKIELRTLSKKSSLGNRLKKDRQAKGILLFLLVAAFGLLTVQPVSAAPHSSNVVMIGGTTLDTTNPCQGVSPTNANVMWYPGGGCLPVTGPVGELGDFNFTPMAPSAVSAASLAAYDTAILNVASSAMACNTNTLTPSQQADLIAFVGSGKKLIIYDSECAPGPLDYSWLPFPFTTSNPGAMGAHGTLTITEDNTLSTLIGDPSCLLGDPYCINVASLGTSTDAVGDMNVMTTYDPNWCLDMSGTNTLNVTGPVHTYADFPTGTDRGLIIYNGLDQDYQYSGLANPDLRKIWVQELQQPFNPALLPCLITPVGIKLAPEKALNPPGQDHTATATLKDLLGTPQPDIAVTFRVDSGINAGASGTCSANADCTTDANGEVSWTYTDSGGVGVDEIVASFVNGQGQPIDSNTALKFWDEDCNGNNIPDTCDIDCGGFGGKCDVYSDCGGSSDDDGNGVPDECNRPPQCIAAAAELAELWPPNHKFQNLSVTGVTDPDGDPISITITAITQDEPVNDLGDGNTCPDGAGVGTATASVRAERSGNKEVPGDGRVYHVSFMAEDGQGGECTGMVTACVPHDQRPGHVCVDEGPLYDSTVCPVPSGSGQ